MISNYKLPISNIYLLSTALLRSNGRAILRLLLILISVVFTIEAHAHHAEVILTDYEKEYLSRLGPVTMCIDPGWRPFEYLDENGMYAGIAADLIQVISERTGIEFKLIPTANWDESLRKSQDGECMILTFLNQTEERKKWLLFTSTYFSDYNVLITREEHEDITNLAHLKGHSLALPTQTSSEERIRQEYPGFRIQLYDTEMETFKAVNDRKADMTMRSLIMSAYVIKTEGWFNLKIAGQLPDYKIDFKIGVGKEYLHLRNILNKAIATLDEHDIQQAINNHVTLTIVDEVNYARIFQIALILAILITIGFTWNYQLRKLNQRLRHSQNELIKLSDQQEREISQRKEVEARLRNSEQQLTNLISNLPGFIYKCLDDEYYTMVLISEGCFSVTGYQPSDFLTNKKINFSDLILPEELATIRHKWEVATKFHSFFEHEYQLKHANGSIRWIWERGYVVYDEDTKQKTMEGFITDITDRKIAESELRRSEDMLRETNAQKDKFFSIIAHDLRSPFTAIVGFSELLARKVDEKDFDNIDEYSDMIVMSSKKTLNLLMNLLEWARSQTDRITFNPEYFELNEVIDETTFILGNMAGQKSLNVILQVPAKTIVHADRHMLSTIVRNLVSNAIKFTPSNGTITISATHNDKETQLTVSDTGIGIRADRIHRLFRIDSSESTFGTNEEEGTGLGLILCKEFTEKHEGTLEVKSEPGKGSTFTLTLPLRL